MSPCKYSKSQQYAIITILILIMEADGIIDPNEVKYIDSVLSEFGISEPELEEISYYDFNHSKEILSKMNNQELEYAKKLFIEMAKCDGYADPRELEIINLLGS